MGKWKFPGSSRFAEFGISRGSNYRTTNGNGALILIRYISSGYKIKEITKGKISRFFLCSRLPPPNLEPFLGGLASYSIHDREQTIDMAWSFIKCVSILPIADSVSVTKTAHPAQYSDKNKPRTLYVCREFTKFGNN